GLPSYDDAAYNKK
ncbi:unnamed protein product, partial [Rotaria magnacalcarata]